MTADLVSTPAHQTLQRVVVWFRLLAFVWMTSLVTATLLDDPGASRLIVVTALAIGALGTTATFLLARRNLLDRWWWVIVDSAGTLFILLAPGLSGSHDLFYGGYGLSWLLLVVWAFPAVLPAAVAVAAVVTAQLVGNEIGTRPTTWTNRVGDVAVWVVSGIVYGWAFFAVRINDIRRREAERALAEERVQRSLAESRASIAADIHDSVLQSLAYIQRHSSDASMAEVAADQDRELRRYLDRLSAEHPDGLEVLLRAAAWDVEDRHEIEIEVVCVGDCPSCPQLEPLVSAAREAMVNAATHSGAARISVFAEARDGKIDIFVRDTGSGFDLGIDDGGKHGIRRSIVGRLERNGGAATITTAPGRGTEVALTIPMDAS
jgi:signal transduction histidine kinase